MKGAEADAMGLLLRERIVFLGSNIDDFVADATISQLLLLDAQDPKDIRLFINCPGGSLSATMAIYDVVQLVRADVSTVALGISASTASIILGGGTIGKRFAMPNTRIMIHQPLGGASGQAIDVEIQAREIMHNKNNVIRIISGFTGRTTEQVQKDIDRDRYMSPIEAVEYGIIDGVIDERASFLWLLCQKGWPIVCEADMLANHNLARIYVDPYNKLMSHGYLWDNGNPLYLGNSLRAFQLQGTELSF
ncbi:hypothetical protein GH714_041051 [Hevea brasiliensis]|uniref:ATP-dependent Clp protease proteolytic subunit n=1 Tax=Hevea brasiliensis TaxID=3981 RepID=A0A6A6MVV9_HEVBR|nr:hypothetical protein GH714_041051 [Hevea brasiliensis]